MTPSSVLLVEDSPTDVLFMRRAWKAAEVGLTLQVAKDGEEALAYLDGEGIYADRSTYPVPAYVLLDLKIPLLSGLEVLAWIRKNILLRELPVYVLTSSEQPDDVRRAKELGISEYLVKPNSYSDLLALVRRIASFL